jgi:hypothetical protein
VQLDWMANFPPELKMTEAKLIEGLDSEHLETRRLSVQSLCLQAAYHQVRCTLHRRYASLPASVGRNSPNAASTDIAISSAEELISLASLASAYLANEAHFVWCSFFTFSAGMLFSFQLIAAPDQPDAPRFRANVARALAALRRTPERRVGPLGIVAKSIQILATLNTLYSDAFRAKPAPEQRAEKAAVLAMVRRLAFPFHGRRERTAAPRSDDAAESARPATSVSSASGSSTARAFDSPDNASIHDVSMLVPAPAGVQAAHDVPMTAPRAARFTGACAPPQLSVQINGGAGLAPNRATWGYSPAGTLYSPSSPTTQEYAPPQAWATAPQHTQYAAPQAPYTHTPVAVSMPYTQDAFRGSGVLETGAHAASGHHTWGAAIGFGQAEWNQFMHAMQAPDGSVHLQ